MGTLKVDNIQKEDGTAILTDGVFSSSVSGAGIVLQQITVAVAKATFTSSIHVSYTHRTMPTMIRG